MPMHTSTEPSPLFGARLAGALWLFVIIASIAIIIGRHPLDWRGDPATLTANAMAMASSIRLGFVVNLFGKICYIGATVLLYELLKPVNKSVALFGAFCGLAGVLSGTSLFNDFTTLSLLEESRKAAEPVASQLQATAKTLMTAHALGTSGEMVFFGSQIAALGFLITRSSFLPRAIGVLLLLGGAGVLITLFTSFVSPTLGARLSPLTLPIVLLGEGSLALWLFVKGVNVEQWQATIARRITIDPAAR